MRRFFLPAHLCREETLQLSDSDAKHAAAILHLRKEDSIRVLDGQGRELLCRVQKIDKQSVQARVLARKDLPKLPYELSLIQAVTKGKSMDAIVQKATEMGCRAIIPVFSERSVVRCDKAAADNKRQKWETIAIEAMKQCGQGWLPKILPPLPLREVLSGNTLPAGQLSFLASLQSGALHPRKHLEDYRNKHGRFPCFVTVWIGPEGDFTPDEVNDIQAGGALPITLGPLILRSETAAICALSFLNYELQSEGISSSHKSASTEYNIR